MFFVNIPWQAEQHLPADEAEARLYGLLLDRIERARDVANELPIPMSHDATLMPVAYVDTVIARAERYTEQLQHLRALVVARETWDAARNPPQPFAPPEVVGTL